MDLACLAALDSSHRRQDDVMAALLAAARRLAAGRPDDGDVAAVRDAVAYFETTVTRHFLDEEGSVFPRLSTRRPELAEALAALSAEHPPQIALQNALAATVKQLDGDSRQGAGKTLLELAERLDTKHRAHVDREDEIFNTAHGSLTAEDDTEIVAEMEMRRDRDSAAGRAAGRRERRDAVSTTPTSKPATAKLTRPAAKRAAKTTTKPKAKAKAKPKKPTPKKRARSTKRR